MIFDMKTRAITLELRESVIKLLESGMPFSRICKAFDISEKAVEAERKQDPDFDLLCETAFNKASITATKMISGGILAAAAQGDPAGLKWAVKNFKTPFVDPDDDIVERVNKAVKLKKGEPFDARAFAEAAVPELMYDLLEAAKTGKSVEKLTARKMLFEIAQVDKMRKKKPALKMVPVTLESARAKEQAKAEARKASQG